MLLLAEEIHRVRHFAAHSGGRRANPAVADDHRRHPLAELRQVLRHADHVDIIMGMHINKARRQYPPLAINHLLRRNVQRRGDSHNSIALHRHISTVLRPAAPVDHRDVFEKPVNFHSNYSLSTCR